MGMRKLIGVKYKSNAGYIAADCSRIHIKLHKSQLPKGFLCFSAIATVLVNVPTVKT